MNGNRAGQIITFYSYKGGTGRSMALANVAWILASAGRRVVMLDWDFEAPGLHRYFYPFLADKDLGSSEGLLELLTRFETAAAFPDSRPAEGEREKPDWFVRFTDFRPYVLPVGLAFPAEGKLDFIHAGRQDRTYGTRVNSFDWGNFYNRLGGGVFLEALKKNLRGQYDYILIDSRTGVSDTAGICTVQLPDTVVACFTYNVQSIEGAAAVSTSILAQRSGTVVSDARPFRIFPVAMRVEQAEKQRLDQMRGKARDAFAGVIDRVDAELAQHYWERNEVPYIPFYAYQEILASAAESVGRPDTMLAACERLTEIITSGKVTKAPPLESTEREKMWAAFMRMKETVSDELSLPRSMDSSKLAESFRVRYRAWQEEKKDPSRLLDREAVDTLRKDVALQMVLLENRDFSSYWEESLVRLRAREAHRQNSIQIASFGLAFAALVVAVWSSMLHQHRPDFNRMLISILSGMCGSLFPAVRKMLKPDPDAPRPDRRSANKMIFRMVEAALFGALIGFTLEPEGGFLGFLYKTDFATADVVRYSVIVALVTRYAVRMLPSFFSRVAKAA